MERAEQEVVARRARRVLWAFRLVFYPSAFILAGALLGARAEEDPSQRLTGRTGQGQAIELQVVDGRPTSFRTRFLVTCGGHPREWPVDWWEHDGRGATFRHHAGGLAVDVSIGQSFDDRSGRSSVRRLRMRARVDADDARGTMSLSESVSAPGGVVYYCVSGDVTFSARAG